MKRYIKTSASNIYKFQVGHLYSGAMLYGGYVNYRIESRTEDTVTATEYHVSEDTGDIVYDGEHTFPIQIIDGSEAFKIWEYRGHEGYLYAHR